MTKPRYTSDPPIVIDGLSPDEKLEIIIDWMQRQFYRQDDWWPDDHSARIDQIEALFPGAPGTWPIVDYSSVSFNPQAAVPIVTRGFLYEGGQVWYLKSDLSGWEFSTSTTGIDLSQVRGWVTDGNGNIMAGGPQSEIVYSTDDGQTFPHVAMPDSDTGDFVSVAYTGGNWYAIGVGTVAEGRPFKCWRSSNLTTWTEIYEETDGTRVNFRPGTGQCLCLDNSGNLCAAVSGSPPSSDHKFRKSTDGGLTWSFVDIGNTLSWNLGYIKNVNGNLVITGNRMSIMVSFDDGATWGNENRLRAPFQFEFAGGLEYGDGRYIYQCGSASSPRTTFVSTDLINWGSYSGFNSQYQSLQYVDDIGFLFTLGGSAQQSDTGLDGSWVDWSGPSSPLTALGLYVYQAPMTL